jgi:hypothetical protein
MKLSNGTNLRAIANLFTLPAVAAAQFLFSALFYSLMSCANGQYLVSCNGNTNC